MPISSSSQDLQLRKGIFHLNFKCATGNALIEERDSKITEQNQTDSIDLYLLKLLPSYCPLSNFKSTSNTRP
ncbi:hypothetical protein M5689_024631 [Euphorbia peplus]|nr:hypothetical protein M5689_024631 [Euphorbia peplus]